MSVCSVWDLCSQSHGLSELLLVRCYLSEIDFSHDFVFLRNKNIHIIFVVTYFRSKPIHINKYLLKTLSIEKGLANILKNSLKDLKTICHHAEPVTITNVRIL